MTDRANSLAHLSSALIERSAAANSAVAALRLIHTAHITATLCQPDVIITSEQSLPERNEFELMASGSTVKAKTAGRDPGTNIAVLKLERQLAAGNLASADGQVGAFAIEFGEDTGGHDTVQLGFVNAIGPDWCYMQG